MGAVGARAGLLEFRILGPLEVWRDDRPVRLSGGRQRELMALLLLNVNEVVPTERLIDALYRSDPSGTAANAVQAIVSRLRRSLADENVLVTRPPGYMLQVDPEQLDVTLFERLTAEGREALVNGDAARAATLLREALGLWRGPPLADVLALEDALPEVRRLEELRLATVMDRIDADLVGGPGGGLAPEIEALVAANPLHERLRGQLMLALYRAGRQAEALAVYRETRDFLRDELGLEPSRALQALERAILVHDESLGPPSRAATTREIVCPFKGLAAFEVADAEFFCGREAAVNDVISRLAASSFVGIVGPSGVGKSSLLRAGVLHRLSVGVLPGSERWQTAIIRPGDRPAEALATATADRANERLLVVVDQLEEAFTVCTDEFERERFFDALAELARRAVVLVTLRADFYGRCARYHEFAKLLSRNHVLVRPMEPDELARAIELPAGRAGLQLERALVDALVVEVAAEPGGLPLLSTALLELWRLRDGATLRFEAYRETGGVRGAVARLAESAYAELTPAERIGARAVFLRLSLGDGETVSRRRVPLGELDADVREVVEHLAAARLLTISEGTVEVAHEAVFREWPRVREWLDEDRDGRRIHAHLAIAAREWDDGGRDDADLYRGARLAAALDWSASHGGELNELERDYLRAGRRSSESEVRRLRWRLALVGLLLLAAIVAGVLTLISRSHARHEATVALAQQLGAEAVSEPRLDRAMLLAREAVKLDDSQVTDGTLLATLLREPAAIGTFALPITDRPQKIRISPDGRTIAAITNTGLVRLYDARTHRQIRAIPAYNADFAYVGRDLFVLSGDAKTLFYELVDPQTGHVLRRYQLDPRILGPTAGPAPVGEMRGGRYLYVAYAVATPTGGDGAAYLDRWPTARGGKPTVFRLDGHGMIAAGAASSGAFVVVTDGLVSLWNAETMRAVRTVAGPAQPGELAAISPDGRVVAFGLPNGEVKFVETTSGRVTTGATTHQAEVASLAFSPDSRIAASGGNDGVTILWNPRDGQPLERLQGHVTAVHGAAFAPDGRTLYTSSLDGTVLQWDMGDARRFGRPFGVGAWPASSQKTAPLALSPDGSRIALLAGTSSVGVYSTATLRREEVVALPHGRDVTAVAWSGTALVVGDDHGDVALYRTPHSRTILRGLPGAVMALAAQGGVVAASGAVPTKSGANASLALWRDGRLVRKPMIVPNIRHVTNGDLEFSSDGSELAAALVTGPVLLVDARTGAVTRTIHPSKADTALAAEFSPDGLLATGSWAGIVTLWDPKTGRQVGHRVLVSVGPANSIAFNPAGTEFATAGNTTKLWSVATQQEIGDGFPPPAISWSHVALTPNGKYLFSVSADGYAVRWPVSVAAWEQHACAVAARNLTHEEWARYISGRPYARVC